MPPSPGPDPLAQALKKNAQNAGLHVAAGEFTKALELLRKQLGISDFSPFKQAFVDIHSLSRLKLQTAPHSNPLNYQMRFIDQPYVTISL